MQNTLNKNRPLFLGGFSVALAIALAPVTSALAAPVTAAPSAWEQLQGMPTPCTQGSECDRLSRAELEGLSCTTDGDHPAAGDWSGGCFAVEALLKFNTGDEPGFYTAMGEAKAACEGDCPTRDRMLGQVDERVTYARQLNRLIAIHWLDLMSFRSGRLVERAESLRRVAAMPPPPPTPPGPPPIPAPAVPRIDAIVLPAAHPSPLYAAAVTPGASSAESALAQPLRPVHKHIDIVTDYMDVARAHDSGEPVSRAVYARLARLEKKTTTDELYYDCTALFPVDACRIHVEWAEYRKASVLVVDALPPRP